MEKYIQSCMNILQRLLLRYLSCTVQNSYLQNAVLLLDLVDYSKLCFKKTIISYFKARDFCCDWEILDLI